MLDVILGEGGFLEQRAFLSLRDKQVKHLVNDIFKFNLPPTPICYRCIYS